MDLLLLSNSTMPQSDYLEWTADDILTFVGDHKKVLFIPFAGVTLSHQAYTDKVQGALPSLEIKGVDDFEEPSSAVQWAESIFVGGGNTFALLNKLHTSGYFDLIKNAIQAGKRYVGWSAGSNVATCSIRTSNDMPIVCPPSFEGFNFFPIQINPHYTEAVVENHGGESRLDRLREFVALNEEPVLCIPEGVGVWVQGASLELKGKYASKMLQKNGRLVEIKHNQSYQIGALQAM